MNIDYCNNETQRTCGHYSTVLEDNPYTGVIHETCKLCGKYLGAVGQYAVDTPRIMLWGESPTGSKYRLMVAGDLGIDAA